MGTRTTWNLDALQLNDETGAPSGNPATGKWWVYMLNDVLTLEDEAGASYDVVTRTQTQTLTNKTLDAAALTGGVTINDAGADVDLRAEGDTDQNLLFLDASTDRVGIGTATPGAKLEVAGSVIVNETGAAVNVRIEGDNNANLLFTDGTNDRVGIGTGSPSQLLHVAGIAQMNTLLFTGSSELTIASGAVTATQTFHTIDTEGDAASDDLDTINGGVAGRTLILRANNTARTVVVTTAGNIVTPTGSSISLDETYKILWLIYDGDLSKWVVHFHSSASSSMDINGLTEETTIAGGDFVPIYDVSAGANRKMTRTNFVAGIGGTAVYPTQVRANEIFPKTTNGSFVQGVDTAQIGNQRFILNNDVTAYVEYQLLLQAGTWRLDCISDKGSSRGIGTFTIDGSAIGTADAYAAGASANYMIAFTGIVVASTAVATIRIATSSKNASSSGYTFVISQLVMTKTA